MTKKLLSLLTVLIVLFGFIGCSDKDKEEETPVETPMGMQVYESDKTTPYTGEDLDFYIQGDTTKTVCAKIKSGKLTIDKIDLPTGCEFGEINGATSCSPTDLKNFNIILTTLDDSKEISYLGVSKGQMAIWYFNKDGSWVIADTTINVTKGWNFYVYPNSSTDPTDDREGKFRWVVESN